MLVGRHLQDTRRTLFVHWPPLFADWDPHLGPGTPAAVLVAAAVVACGPSVAARLPWRWLLLAAWATALAWTWSLALVDGWRRGVAGRLTTRNEYLTVIGRFHDVPAALRDFTHHIVSGSPDPWPAHVAGHPPAATLTFVLLDRAGLRGGGWAGAWCVTVGATACVAVLVGVRALAGERPARRAAPFLVLAPAAVWVGASADGYFAAVAAWSVALLALAVTGRSVAWAAGGGLLYGLTCYLSYGLTLFALIAAAVLWAGRHRVRARPVLPVLFLAGAAVVPVVFTRAGFDWWEGYRLLVTRYYQGVGGTRPYGYWVWANLACTVLITGPATVAGLRRAALLGIRPRTAPRDGARLALLVAAALLALLVADLSGMSKAETERIWLPFAMWLLAAGAFLPRPRGWLAAQAVLALLLNHLLFTGW
ncbi:membrane protein [Streptomyces libani subsp. rufus]|nr:membrane protein [Streptomyces libani subsp. rufus]